MKKIPTLFLKIVIIALCVGVLALCIFGLPAIPNGNEPTAAIKNSLYLFLAAAYISAIPFFIAAFQGFQLLRYIDQEKAFSDKSVKSLGIIKWCGIFMTVAFAGGMPFMHYVAQEEDAPGLILVGLAFVLAPLVIAVFAAVLQKLLQAVVQLKSENDLTV